MTTYCDEGWFWYTPWYTCGVCVVCGVWCSVVVYVVVMWCVVWWCILYFCGVVHHS